MNDISITFEQLKDRPINYVSVYIGLESGCDPKEGEYSLHLNSLIGVLDIGGDDMSKVIECANEYVMETDLPEEGSVQLILKESGEWEGYSWNKYYEIDRVCIIN